MARTKAPTITPEVVPLDTLAETFGKLRNVRKRLSKLEVERNALERTIKEALGDSPRGTIGGQDAVYWTRTQRTQVDVPKLREKYPDIAESCIKLTEVRTFRIVDPS